MGFNIAQSPEFWMKVELLVTGEDGRPVVGEVKAKFKRLKREALMDFLTRHKNATPTPENMGEVMTDWKGMTDDAGEMTFTPENFKRACEAIPGAALAFSQAFIKGSWGAREGN